MAKLFSSKMNTSPATPCVFLLTSLPTDVAACCACVEVAANAARTRRASRAMAEICASPAKKEPKVKLHEQFALKITIISHNL